MKPNALLISRNLPPLLGGMERLNWHLAQELTQSYELTIVGPKEANHCKPLKTTFIGAELKPLWKFLISSFYISLCEAKKTKPEIIIAGSGLTAPAALLSAKISGAKSVAYIHGLDIAVNHPIYKWFWLPAIRRLDLIIANSTATAKLIKNIGIHEDFIRIIHPGVSPQTYTPTHEEIEQFKDTHSLTNKSILLSVGRLTERKGLLEFITTSLPILVKEHPNTLLLVIGSSPDNALLAKSISQETMIEAAKKINIENHIKFIGRVDESTLIRAFHSSIVHVFPIKEIAGDPEGFGMVAIEAAMHGLPTVSFAVGGVTDAIQDGISGYLVPPQQYNLLADKILSLIKKETLFNKDDCIAFACEFEWSIFGKKINRALSEIK